MEQVRDFREWGGVEGILEYIAQLKEIAYQYQHASDGQSRRAALRAWRRATAGLGLAMPRMCRHGRPFGAAYGRRAL